MTVGAYELDALASVEVGAGVSVAVAGAGAKAKERARRIRGSGQVAACERGDASAPCAAILQLSLAPLQRTPFSAATAVGFGQGIGAVSAMPRVQQFAGRVRSKPGLGADVTYLKLVQAAKRADRDDARPALSKAKAWDAVAGYNGDNPLESLAEARAKQWREVDRAARARRVQLCEVGNARAKDIRRLAELKALDDDVYSAEQKRAAQAEFDSVYGPWEVALGASTESVAGLRWLKSGPARVEFTRSEVTVAQFAECEADGACKTSNFRSGGRCNWNTVRTDHPMNCVNWQGAVQFCRWADGRLPTEKEWVAEASDGGARKYPWADGAQASCDRVVMDDGGAGCTPCTLLVPTAR